MAKGFKSAVINFNSTGDNTVIAAIAGASIKVYGYDLTVTAATNLVFKDGTTAVSGTYDLTGAGSSITHHPSEHRLYYCAPGDAFVINQSGTASVQGTIWYTNG